MNVSLYQEDGTEYVVDWDIDIPALKAGKDGRPYVYKNVNDMKNMYACFTMS